MAELPEFQKKQYAFAAHLRDPKNTPAPEGIEERRIEVYRGLFFNNLKSLLATTYPVTKKLVGDTKWRRFIRQFMQKHQAQTPYFLELPAEFLEFLQTEYEQAEDDFPFLTELAHYEYVELALSIATDVDDLTGIDPDGDLRSGQPVKSLLAWTFAYHYPVHRINEDFKPDAPSEQPVYLALYRREDDKVSFMELNPVTAALLDALENNAAAGSGETLLRELSAQIGYADADAFVAHGVAALEAMRQIGIVTGTKTAGERS